ncbi:MAG: Smr/MutS family protein [Acidobacteria bacterium]|nr:Smr/MutS family protein [Acidobacteriota bacterium]
MRGMKVEGTIVSLDPESAWLDVGGKRMRVSRSELEPAGTRVTGSGIGNREPSDQRERDGRGTPRSTGSGIEKRKKTRVARQESRSESEAVGSGPVKEVNVIGKRLDEAIDEVEKALDEALVAGVRLRVIHGHGTGRLRDGLREHLRKHPNVASARAADAREGGNGATMVELQ